MTTDEPLPMPSPGRTTSVAAMMAWFGPYLRPHRRLLAAVIAASVAMLAAQVTLPLVVERVLTIGEARSWAFAGLVAVVALQVAASHGAVLGAHRLADRSSHDLRTAVFDRTVATDMLHQRGLVRSSIVSRHSTDVDVVAEAVADTVVSGLPGAARVVISLALLTVIDWRAAVAMVVATALFVAYRRQVGRTLLVVDRARVDARSRVNAAVDEALTGSQVVAGLNIGGWQRQRFSGLSHNLEAVSARQSRVVARLFSAADLTGLTGLVVVVALALTAGGTTLAAVAAAILYVNGVVRGLEALPPWLRSVQLAIVSQIRIDEILGIGDRTTTPDHHGDVPAATAPTVDVAALGMVFSSGVELTDGCATISAGVLTGVVTPAHTEVDELFALLGGDGNPPAGSITVAGVDVRVASVHRRVMHVPATAVAFDVDVLTHLRATGRDLTEPDAAELLGRVGLGHLADLEHGLHTRLGHAGSLLSQSERQLLALAMALAAAPDVLIVGPLLALAEPDTARPLIDTLRSSGIATVVVAVDSPQVAAHTDAMVFVTGGTLRTGTHAELLAADSDYAELWHQRLTTTEVDLSVLGIADADASATLARMVTERYEPGQTVYRQGDPADRMVFVVSGHVDVTVNEPGRGPRRVAVLGPGNHCGDPRLAMGHLRAETVTAADHCVVRCLSRAAITSSMAGLMERTPAERRVLAYLLRHGPTSGADLGRHLADPDVAAAINVLVGDNAIVDTDGRYHVVHTRTRTRTSAVLDKLADL